MWHAFDDGKTLGQKGSEKGETIRDEEHDLGARITLERNAEVAPFAITCGIYGLMVHTRFFETEDEAIAECHKMKASLSEIVQQFSDPGFNELQAIEAMEAFIKTYP
jgi:hypothetical protein